MTFEKIIDHFRKNNLVYEFSNDTIKVNNFEIKQKEGRYYLEEDGIEQFSSDLLEDVYWYLCAYIYENKNPFFDNSKYCHIFNVLAQSAAHYVSVELEKETKKFCVVDMQVCYMNAGCTEHYYVCELTKEKFPKLLDEAVENGFVSESQRKYLEEYIKL